MANENAKQKYEKAQQDFKEKSNQLAKLNQLIDRLAKTENSTENS